MFNLILVFLAWSLCIWYFYDSYSDAKKLNMDVADIFRNIKIGICEHNRCLADIIASEASFKGMSVSDFSLFLWENHERLGLSVDHIDAFNAYVRESEFAPLGVCLDGITALERRFREALRENSTLLKQKFISVATLSTAAFGIGIMLLV